MKKQTFYRLIRLGAAVALLLTVRGFANLWQVEGKLRQGAVEVRSALQNAEAVPSAGFTETEQPTQALAQTGEASEALALLTVPAEKDYEVAVYDVVTEETLYKGAGRVGGVRPNEAGNCILYGHRDSAFRFITKAKPGQELLLQTASGQVRYQIAVVTVVEPDDPRIFAASDQRKLTLVTCYPFWFVGPAPQRCMVEAFEAP